MFRFLRRFMIGGALLACGTPENNADKHVFNNSLDPRCTTGTTLLGSCGMGEGSAGTDKDSPGAPTGTENKDTAGSTVADNAPDGSQFNFSSQFSVTPQGCSKVDQAQVFDNGAGLMIFVKATCTDRAHVYGFTASYEGKADKAPLLITGECNTGTVGVKSFASDKGSDGFVVVYVCATTTSASSARIVHVSSGLVAETPTVLEAEPAGLTKYRMAWNDAASAFGLARTGQFQRLGSDGALIGGPISLKASSQINQLSVDGDKWLITHRSAESYTDYYLTRYSSISASGILGCNAVDVGIKNSRSADPRSTKFGAGILAGTSKLVHFAGRVNTGLADFLAVDVDPVTCKETGDESQPVTLTSTIESGNGPAYQVLDGLLINANIGAILFNNTKSLLLLTYPRAGTFQIYAEASIAGFTTLGSAESRIINDRLYVAFAKDGDGLVSYSSETLP